MAETWDNKAMKGSDIQSMLTQVYTDLNGKADKDSCDAQSARYIRYANLNWNGTSGRGLLLSIAVDSTANAQVTARFILLWNEAQARVSQAGILSISLRRGNSAGGEVSKAVDLLVGRSYSSMPTIEVTWDGSNNKLNVYGYHASSGYRGLRAVPIESSTWGAAVNSIDKITLYGSASASSETQKTGTDVEVSRRTLPWLSGTSKGSSTVPVYVDSDGSVKECSSDFAQRLVVEQTDGAAFTKISAAITAGKDVWLKTGETSSSASYTHYVPLVEAVSQSGSYTSFIFSRPNAWRTDAEGVIDVWTCTSSGWTYTGKNVYYADNAGVAGSAGTATSATNYVSGGNIWGITEGYKIRVVNNLPSSPAADTIYFI